MKINKLFCNLFYFFTYKLINKYLNSHLKIKFMESFKINNIEYFVKWTHLVSEEMKITRCDIFDSQQISKINELNEIEYDIPVTYAYSKLSPKDIGKFSKMFGCRLSFQRALFGKFNKEERTEIWKYAFDNFKTKLRQTNICNMCYMGNQFNDYKNETSQKVINWDNLAELLKDKFGESLIEDTEFGDEENPYNWWLTDVTVSDIINFFKENIKE